MKNTWTSKVISPWGETSPSLESAHTIWKLKEVDTVPKKKKQERVEKEKRLCKNCSSGEVEDEKHVVMMCPKYNHARRTMLNSLTEAFPPLENLTKHETFLFIMRCHDWEVADALSKMLATVRCERGSLWSTLKHLSPITKPIPHYACMLCSTIFTMLKP